MSLARKKRKPAKRTADFRQHGFTGAETATGHRPALQQALQKPAEFLTCETRRYSAAGDLTADGAHTYQWDAEGRLISVDGGQTASYVYDALGRRVEKQAGSNYTEYAYNAAGESVGENNRSIWTEKYFTFDGRNLAHYHSNGTYFMHSGRIGTTAQVTDYTGPVVQDELHYPWGQQWQLAGTAVEERFARLGLRDAETSFDPTRYHLYASNQGRWLSPRRRTSTAPGYSAGGSPLPSPLCAG